MKSCWLSVDVLRRTPRVRIIALNGGAAQRPCRLRRGGFTLGVISSQFLSLFLVFFFAFDFTHFRRWTSVRHI